MATDANSNKSDDVRWIQRLSSYSRALGQLRSAAELASQRQLSDLEKQGLIQAFEFTHELAWNVMRDLLRAHGSTENIYGSKDATRAAFNVSLIEDGDAWLEMIACRNRTSPTYNEETANEIVNSILGTFVGLFGKFEARLTEMNRVDG
ncbi:MAG TPA: nucleotidyltransferase substrate binding protein [Fimbriimonadaceae bacterium]|nr:nucleotidyltransferase substrate binding protein [Fimbriimonadaceae bacterium]